MNNNDMKLVYTAISKHYFYFRMQISKFVLEQGCVPLNPFMIFEYFMLDTVERDKIRNANNSIIKRADGLWVFGPISDGVLAEIRLAKKMNKPIRYFTVVDSKEIKEMPKNKVKFEGDLKKFFKEL